MAKVQAELDETREQRGEYKSAIYPGMWHEPERDVACRLGCSILKLLTAAYGTAHGCLERVVCSCS
jgi:hypothetical protein